MAAIVTSIDVDRPAGEVYAYATDPARFSEWQQGVVDGHLEASGLTVEPLAADRSRLTISVDFTGHGIGRILVPLMVRREAVTEMPANLTELKRRLELSS